MLPSIIALMAALLLVAGLNLDLYWPGGLVIFVAIFAAVRALMRRLFREAKGPRSGFPRGRNGGASSRRGPWY